MDWTLAFRRLAGAVEDAGPLRALFADPAALDGWLPRWRAALAPDARALMAAANPAVIPRNHLVEEALTAATAGDMAPFAALLAEVRRSFTRPVIVLRGPAAPSGHRHDRAHSDRDRDPDRE